MKLPRRNTVALSPDQLDQTLEALEAFLRTELCAAEAYRAALRRAREPSLRESLARLGNSHLGRACLLRERFDEFGGRHGGPGSMSEPWGAFASAIERVRKAPDEPAMLGALCEAEAWAVKDYEADLVEVEASVREALDRIVLPEQRRTHATASRLLAERASASDAPRLTRRRWFILRAPSVRIDERIRLRA